MSAGRLPKVELRTVELCTKGEAAPPEARRRIESVLESFGHVVVETKLGETDTGVAFLASLSEKRSTRNGFLCLWDVRGEDCYGSLGFAIGVGDSVLVVDDLCRGPGDEVACFHWYRGEGAVVFVPTSERPPDPGRALYHDEGSLLLMGRAESGADVVVITTRERSGRWPRSLWPFEWVWLVHVWDGEDFAYVGVAPDTRSAALQATEGFVREALRKQQNREVAWSRDDLERLHQSLGDGTYVTPLLEGIGVSPRERANSASRPGLPSPAE